MAGGSFRVQSRLLCRVHWYFFATNSGDILHLVIEGTRKKFTQIDLFNKLSYK